MTKPASALALAILAGLVAHAGTSAHAQPAPAAEALQQPRFAFSPVEGGALKLDTQSGQVSLCTKGSTGFACIAVPDTRDAYEAEIARLQNEITALKQASGAPATPQTAPQTAPQAAPPAGPQPSDVDRALDYASSLYRKFRQLIDELRAPDQSERL